MSPTAPGCDIRDLYLIHRVIRTAFSRAPGLVAAAGDDPARHELLDAHIKEITEALHRHHHGEDLTLWDRLAERRPACALHVEQMRAQHADIGRRLTDVKNAHARWKADRSGANAELAAALEAVDTVLAAHLGDEEAFVAEHAPALLTQTEWDEMRDHGIAGIPKNRLLIQLGHMLRAFESEEERAEFWRAIPLPARAMYRLFGERQLTRELTALYGPDDAAGRSADA